MNFAPHQILSYGKNKEGQMGYVCDKYEGQETRKNQTTWET